MFIGKGNKARPAWREKMKTACNLRHEPQQFVHLASAQSCVAHTVKPMRILLGVGRFLVVCPADASRLEKLGFSYAL